MKKGKGLAIAGLVISIVFLTFIIFALVMLQSVYNSLVRW